MMNYLRMTRRTKYSCVNGQRVTEKNREALPEISLQFHSIRRQIRTPEEREAARIQREAKAAARRLAAFPRCAVYTAALTNQDDDVQLIVPPPIQAKLIEMKDNNIMAGTSNIRC